ncbi:MAG: hypothetical protein JSV77_08090 [Dehalococcoidales bacterium]|nr:MAG: hypothetical protein JSV77_08090 [Dehalococcoidales bacterium]
MTKTPSKRSRSTESIIAIVWSIATLIFFNFFRDYIAIYHDGMRELLITAEFGKWLWIHNPLLIFTVIGHSISLAFDRYILRESILVFLTLLGVASTAVLLSLFPFDFSIIANANIEKWVDLGLRIALILTIVAFSIGALVSINKLIRNFTSGTKDY